MASEKLIRITKETKDALDELKLVEEETYNSIIKRLLKK